MFGSVPSGVVHRFCGHRVKRPIEFGGRSSRMAEIRRRFSEEFKREAARLASDSGRRPYPPWRGPTTSPGTPPQTAWGAAPRR